MRLFHPAKSRAVVVSDNRKTRGRSHCVGETLEEAKKINASLTALGKVGSCGWDDFGWGGRRSDAWGRPVMLGFPVIFFLQVYNGCLRYVGHVHLFIGEQ